MVAAQVAGAVVALEVKAGDSVKAGQVLLRIDARAAEQNASASEAQVQSAQALLDVARKDFERQKQLFEKHYISQAALERAESQFKATQAQAAAQLAQAGAARTQSGLHVRARALCRRGRRGAGGAGRHGDAGPAAADAVRPGALRVTAAVPQSRLGAAVGGLEARVARPAAGSALVHAQRGTAAVLPTVDAATHTVQLRLDLPAGWDGRGAGPVRPRLAADGAPATAATGCSCRPPRSCAAPR